MNNLIKISDSLSQKFLIRVIRRGMTMLIPMLLISSVVQALIALPIPAYGEFITAFCGGVPYTILSYIRDFAFSYFSVTLTLAISISFVLEKETAIEVSVFAPLTACVSFLLIMRLNAGGAESKLGVQSSFLAMVVALVVSAVYVRLVDSKLGSLWKISSGHDVIYKGAMRALIPMIVIIPCAALCSFLLYDILGIDNITLWLGALIDNLVSDLKSDFAVAVVCTAVIHSLWFFGIHGSNVVENVMQAHTAVGPDIIFSKTFFDVFVLMGGCGTSVCILLSILLFSRYGKFKSIAKTAFFPVMLNINEIITFGFPIIWNPVMLIPFMLVPLECIVISYFAIKAGIVAPVISEVTWTTPILVSGYAATGSVGGLLLQLVNITIGTATYTPFIRIYENVYAKRVKAQIKEMVDELKEKEESDGEVTFLERTDTLGVAANMLMDDLRDAVKNKQLYIVFQPQFEADGRCVGAEALSRWKHPMAGPIYPPLIIYMAKKGGFLSQLEENLFDEACRAIKETQQNSDKPFKISVNVTARSLKWDGLERCISDSVEKYGISPDKLWIEITEQDIISRDQEILDKITRLRQKGHEFLIDDFGMGRTSILYLQTELFDGVKLDGSLVKTIVNDERSREIVSSVIDLGKKLNVRTVAEYVETKEICQMLDSLGCDWYQGYYFSKPVSLIEFMDILNK